MIDKKLLLKMSLYEDYILELIENQLRNDDHSLTQSDLQGVVGAMVRKIYNHG